MVFDWKTRPTIITQGILTNILSHFGPMAFMTNYKFHSEKQNIDLIIKCKVYGCHYWIRNYLFFRIILAFPQPLLVLVIFSFLLVFAVHYLFFSSSFVIRYSINRLSFYFRSFNWLSFHWVYDDPFGVYKSFLRQFMTLKMFWPIEYGMRVITKTRCAHQFRYILFYLKTRKSQVSVWVLVKTLCYHQECSKLFIVDQTRFIESLNSIIRQINTVLNISYFNTYMPIPNALMDIKVKLG